MMGAAQRAPDSHFVCWFARWPQSPCKPAKLLTIAVALPEVRGHPARFLAYSARSGPFMVFAFHPTEKAGNAGGSLGCLVGTSQLVERTWRFDKGDAVSLAFTADAKLVLDNRGVFQKPNRKRLCDSRSMARSAASHLTVRVSPSRIPSMPVDGAAKKIGAN